MNPAGLWTAAVRPIALIHHQTAASCTHLCFVLPTLPSLFFVDCLSLAQRLTTP